MALFSKKKAPAKKAAAPKKEKKAVAKGDKVVASQRILSVILRPRITEKAAHLAGARTYTFTVLPDATKREIALAVQAVYGVTPKSVNTAVVRPKRRVRKNIIGATSQLKKAYVRLAEGDTIEFV